MDFMEQHHQKSKHTEEELVPINSQTPCLSETTEIINEISVKLPSQFLFIKLLHPLTIIFIRLE